MKWLLFAGFCFPVLAWGAPPDPPAPPSSTRQILIDPQVRRVWSRAVQLYGSASTFFAEFQTRLSSSDEPTPSVDKITLAYDARGKLRIEGDWAQTGLWVVDGKHSYTLVDSGANVSWRRDKINPQGVKNEISTTLIVQDVWLFTLNQWLNREDRFDLTFLRNYRPTTLKRLRATLLKPQLLGGQVCDLVRQTELESNGEISQEIFWFARSDGRLLRYQWRGGKSGEWSSEDTRIQRQRFNTALDPKLFVFTPPKGAKFKP